MRTRAPQVVSPFQTDPGRQPQKTSVGGIWWRFCASSCDVHSRRRPGSISGGLLRLSADKSGWLLKFSVVGME